jgi:hypothetical protein
MTDDAKQRRDERCGTMDTTILVSFSAPARLANHPQFQTHTTYIIRSRWFDRPCTLARLFNHNMNKGEHTPSMNALYGWERANRNGRRERVQGERLSAYFVGFFFLLYSSNSHCFHPQPRDGWAHTRKDRRRARRHTNGHDPERIRVGRERGGIVVGPLPASFFRFHSS